MPWCRHSDALFLIGAVKNGWSRTNAVKVLRTPVFTSPWRHRPAICRDLCSTRTPPPFPSPSPQQSPLPVSPSTREHGLRRFYNRVTVRQKLLSDGDLTSREQQVDGSTHDAWGIWLDDRPLLTPGGNPFLLPNQKAASLIGNEWEKQQEFLNVELMPFTNLAILTLDLISHGNTRLGVETETLRFLQTDTALFREGSSTESSKASASHVDSEGRENRPLVPSLLQKQSKFIDPVLRKIEQHYALQKQLQTSNSFQPPQQHPPDLDTLASILKRKSVWELGCLFTLVRHLKSYLLSVSVIDGLISMEEACKAAHLEERHQRELWGELDERQDLAIATMWVQAAVLFHDTLRAT